MVFGSEPVADEATIIVSGVGRSGTSMAAGALAALGLPMGDTGGLAVYEDTQLSPALYYFDHAARARIIAARNAETKKWGFKFPSLQLHLHPAELRQFRNPRLIVITRDLVAVAQRAVKSDPDLAVPFDALWNITRQQNDMVDFLYKAQCPRMVMSYEKAVQFPVAFVEMMASFCGLKVDHASVDNAVRTVSPNNEAYRKLFHTEAA
jgi:hypothetical protein